jgi:hypothetical protein
MAVEGYLTNGATILHSVSSWMARYGYLPGGKSVLYAGVVVGEAAARRHPTAEI